MALSEEERRVLAEMERQLTGVTADVVSVASRRANVTLVTVGVLVLVAGIGVLIGGVVSQLPVVGVAGFGVMVVGTLLALNRKGEVRSASASRAKSPRSKIADRWDRRMDGEV
jgi:hypothetical protein